MSWQISIDDEKVEDFLTVYLYIQDKKFKFQFPKQITLEDIYGFLIRETTHLKQRLGNP